MLETIRIYWLDGKWSVSVHCFCRLSLWEASSSSTRWRGEKRWSSASTTSPSSREEPLSL